jgi:hypothetical protein
MAALEACGCDCGISGKQWVNLVDNSETAVVFWKKCECTLCGPPGRGCIVDVSPILQLRVAFQRADRTSHADDPVWCGDCAKHNLLELRRAAVIRSRSKRAHFDLCEDPSLALKKSRTSW